MELDYVKEFVVLADTCNFQIAADSLFMSQSSLSKHIQKLEEDLNFSLFDRSKRSVTLSEGGNAFLEYARELSKIYELSEKAVSSYRKTPDKTLHIGFTRILGQYNLLEQLTDFSIKHPEIKTSLYDQNGDQVRSRLTSGESDFVFTAEADDLDERLFEKMIYKTERMTVLLPPGHSLSTKETIHIKELKNEKFIEHYTPLEQKLFESLCLTFDIKPNTIAHISDSVAIQRMVSQGLGISVLSEGSCEQYGTLGLSRHTLEPAVTFDIYLIYKHGTLSAAARQFLDFIRVKCNLQD